MVIGIKFYFGQKVVLPVINDSFPISNNALKPISSMIETSEQIKMIPIKILKVYQVTIYANQEWQATQYCLIKSVRKSISIGDAGGEWSYNQSDPSASCSLKENKYDPVAGNKKFPFHGEGALAGQLIAKIGNEEPFSVVDCGAVKGIDRDGILYFRINDGDVSDNTGSLSVYLSYSEH